MRNTSRAGDLFAMAWAQLRSSGGKTTALGLPVGLGVAIVVASMATLQSARLELRHELLTLGADQVVVTSAAESDDGMPRLPTEAKSRATRLSAALEVTALTEHSDATVLASTVAEPLGSPATATTVFSADPDLMVTLRVGLRAGRFLRSADELAMARVAVIGTDTARRFGIETVGTTIAERSVLVEGRPFVVVGILDPSPSFPRIDAGVVVPAAAAALDLDDDLRPTHLVVRSEPDATPSMVRALPRAISYGSGPDPNASTPSDLRRAGAAFDSTLGLIVAGSGTLTMALGAAGIAVVIWASVQARTNEIGIRQAIGATRSDIAMLFLLESAVLGLLGALAGVILGPLVGGAIALARHGPVVVDLPLDLAVGAVALELTLLCGAVPAIRASRLQPLTALAR